MAKRDRRRPTASSSTDQDVPEIADERLLVRTMMRKNRRLPRISKARLEEMTEQATVAAYSESEQITGWFTMIEENLGVPFETTVLEFRLPSKASI